MIIDSTHWIWIGVAAVGAVGSVTLYACLAAHTPSGLTGGTTVGLWYGAAASALMIFAGLLSVLRRVPSWWWIGSRQFWLRGHIWLGLLSGVLVLCHSGLRWGGLLEQALCWVLIALLVSGVFGAVLQHFLPRLLKRQVPMEAPYEQLPHLYRVLVGRVDELVEAVELWPATAPQTEEKSELRQFADGVVRPFLIGRDRRSPLATHLGASAAFTQLRARLGLGAAADYSAEAETIFGKVRLGLDALPDKKDLLTKADAAFKKVRDVLTAPAEAEDLAATAKKASADLPAFPEAAGVAGLVHDLQRLCQARWLSEMEAICQERRGYAEQERIHRWLHGWLLLHIPLSLALLVLGVLHAVLSLTY